MTLKRSEKGKILEELHEKLSKASATVLTDFKGLTVAEMMTLRDALAAEKIEYKVVKNTLMRMACRGTEASVLEPLIQGTCAIAIGYDDPTVPARILKKITKTHDKLKIKGGALGGKILTAEEVMALADLPSKQELRAQLLGVLAAVPTALVTALSGIPRNFVGVLAALKQKKEEQQGDA
ncbi:MAG: 50S ribosomal protein L10 [Thermodesulforhabdaceae bacterium]